MPWLKWIFCWIFAGPIRRKLGNSLLKMLLLDVIGCKRCIFVELRGILNVSWLIVGICSLVKSVLSRACFIQSSSKQIFHRTVSIVCNYWVPSCIAMLLGGKILQQIIACWQFSMLRDARGTLKPRIVMERMGLSHRCHDSDLHWWHLQAHKDRQPCAIEIHQSSTDEVGSGLLLYGHWVVGWFFVRLLEVERLPWLLATGDPFFFFPNRKSIFCSIVLIIIKKTDDLMIAWFDYDWTVNFPNNLIARFRYIQILLTCL